jgi:hypothetical protein
MGKIRRYFLKGKEIGIGLEDSKKTWKMVDVKISSSRGAVAT